MAKRYASKSRGGGSRKPLLLGILIAGVLLFFLLRWLFGGSPSAGVEPTFPYAYMNPQTRALVVIRHPWPGADPLTVEDEESGATLYQAYICLSDQCPVYKKTGKRYLFARTPETLVDDKPVCPRCKEGDVRRAQRDAVRYHTPEGVELTLKHAREPSLLEKKLARMKQAAAPGGE